MNRPSLIAPDLRRLFRAIAHTTLASGWLAACAEDTEAQQHADAATFPPASGDAGPSEMETTVPDEVDAASSESVFERVPCPQGTVLPGGELRTPAPISALGIYTQANGIGAIAWPNGESPFAVSESARFGVMCAGAADSSACEKDLWRLEIERCATLPCRVAIAAEPAGLRRIEERAELLRLLGDIDTAAETVLLASFDGRRLCPGLGRDPLDIGAEVRSTPSGYQLQITREGDSCSRTDLTRTKLLINPAGQFHVVSVEMLRGSSLCAGRRPPGLSRNVTCEQDQQGRKSQEVGTFLAGMARLEHASIYAFYQLIRELGAHGAPEALRVLALDAMLDEVRHVLDTATLARQFGAEVVWAHVKQTALRSLLELALDNAREGCVRETFGALLATYQAASAEDANVRSVMARIAEDETRHATFSWRLMEWLTPLLSESEQERVAEASAEAHAELAIELKAAPSDSVRRTLGMPSPEVAAVLLRQMSDVLLS